MPPAMTAARRTISTAPFNKEEYEAFYEALVHAESVELHEFEKEYFKVYEGCMPIEVLAKRGPDTIRYGPLRPVGLRDPRTGHRPWAVVQLRRENAAGTMYNIVGFQTNLLFPEQKRVFSMIPGLENAEFVRYGVMHRNTFLDSPRLLDGWFRLKKRAEGQLCRADDRCGGVYRIRGERDTGGACRGGPAAGQGVRCCPRPKR